MSLLAWGPSLYVGFRDIDEQHKQLVKLVNELNDAMRSRQGRTVVGKVLKELVDYTVTHFAFEERLMDRYKIEFAPAHKAEHAKLVADVSAFKEKFDAGSVTVSIEVMNFLRDWLNRHILQTDRKLAAELVNRGAAAA